MKGSCLSGETCPAKDRPTTDQAGVRAAIRAEKAGNAAGAKGGRKVNASSERSREEEPASVRESDKQAGEDLWQRYKAKREVWSEKMLLALDRGVQGNKWFSLIDKIYADRTLELAWEKVKSNAGACGGDGITMARFTKDSQRHLLDVKEHLKKQSYQPTPVKRVWIPKPGSAEKRPLGIPTVRDRVVQQATKMVIEPIFEKDFNAHSYGFRSGRGCKDALRRVNRLLNEGHLYVVDVDIKGYFDAIDHERLMEKVALKISDGRLLRLLESFLKAGVMNEIQSEATDYGTPQGGVISPVLANIYLNDLDWLMEERGYAITRYADDMVVICRSLTEAHKALEGISEWMKEAKLQLHPQKTRIVDMTQPEAYFDFLGYRFKRTKKSQRLIRLPRPKSEDKIRDKIRKLTRRNNGQSIEQIVQSLNKVVKGWFKYFKHAHPIVMEDLDEWTRMRLRSILRRRDKKKGPGRGLDHYKWPNRYFTKLGLFSLQQARLEIISLRKE